MKQKRIKVRLTKDIPYSEFGYYKIGDIGYIDGYTENTAVVILEDGKFAKVDLRWIEVVKEEDNNDNIELKESEDERIRKEIIAFITTTPKARTSHKEWISWLEKKGEQKPADKTEPKFKIGDWIVSNEQPNCGNSLMRIVEVGLTDYLCRYYNGQTTYCREFIDKNYHLWTIRDAKDGDILYCKSSSDIEYIVMSKGVNKHGNIDSYFRYNSLDGFGVDIPNVLSTRQDNITPATKEQRDFLFLKMKEAGYVWDAEKKELKKIENETEISFGANDSELQEATYYIPKGFHAEIDNNKVVIKKGEKPTTWNEEDEKIIDSIIDYMRPMPIFFESTKGESGKEYTEKFIDKATNWLEALKERGQLHNTWKPSDKQMNALDNARHSNSFNVDILDTLFHDLKKLREE